MCIRDSSSTLALMIVSGIIALFHQTAMILFIIIIFQFDGANGDRLIQVGSEFTKNQKYTLEELKQHRSSDHKLHAFLNQQEGMKECRKLQLQAMLPAEHQRLVKYPLMLEQLAKQCDRKSTKSNKVLVIGAGVAGLQAIATAKRLGAIVSATDVRTVAKEQVESLGGKFLAVEVNENLETAGGYAKEVGEDFKRKQSELLKNEVKKNDIIICTALVPGKKAPRIISEDMVKSMKPGSIIYDLAVGQGGNSAFSEADKVNVLNGVNIIVAVLVHIYLSITINGTSCF